MHYTTCMMRCCTRVCLILLALTTHYSPATGPITRQHDTIACYRPGLIPCMLLPSTQLQLQLHEPRAVLFNLVVGWIMRGSWPGDRSPLAHICHRILCTEHMALSRRAHTTICFSAFHLLLVVFLPIERFHLVERIFR